MRRLIAVLAALGLVLVLGASQALAADKPNDNGKGPKDNDTKVQLLAINDFHGHLEPTTPGTIQVGCCNPVLNSSGVQTGWAARSVPAGGVEYLATHIKQPARTELEHDHRRRRRPDRREPAASRGSSTTSPRSIALNRSASTCHGVGNHEFDEGDRRAAAHAERRLPPRPTTCRGDGFAGRRLPVPRGERVPTRRRTRPSCPPYEIQEDRQREDRVHRAHARGHADVVTPTGVAGLDFRRRGRHGQRAGARLRNEQGVRGVRRPAPPGRLPEPPASRLPAPANPDATRTSTSASTSAEPRSSSRRTGSTRRSTSSSAPTRTAPYICTRSDGQARHERRVVRPRGHRHRPDDRPTRRRTSSRRRRRTT